MHSTREHSEIPQRVCDNALSGNNTKQMRIIIFLNIS